MPCPGFVCPTLLVPLVRVAVGLIRSLSASLSVTHYSLAAGDRKQAPATPPAKSRTRSTDALSRAARKHMVLPIDMVLLIDSERGIRGPGAAVTQQEAWLAAPRREWRERA